MECVKAIRGKINAFGVFVGNLKKRDHLDEMSIDGRIRLKSLLNESHRMAWISSRGSEHSLAVLNTLTDHRFP
jgi:hypothetical protein